jgi:hypothetical protein
MRRAVMGIGIALASCGGDIAGQGGRGASTFTTSVDGGQPFASLSPGDQVTFCNDTIWFLEHAVIPPDCKLMGVEAALGVSATASDGDRQIACTKAQKSCETADAGLTCDFSAFTPENCTATVSDFASCLDGIGSSASRAAAALPDCNVLTRQSLAWAIEEDDAGSPVVLSCILLDQNCPGAMGASGTPGH